MTKKTACEAIPPDSIRLATNELNHGWLTLNRMVQMMHEACEKHARWRTATLPFSSRVLPARIRDGLHAAQPHGWTVFFRGRSGSRTRHVYEFSDGSVEHIALFQGANPDMGASVSLPRGALVTDVSMTLSGPLQPDGLRSLPMTVCTGFEVQRATLTTGAAI